MNTPVKATNQEFLLEATKRARAVAIVGLDKNAGKTTVLNALVHVYRNGKKPIVLTSIGYDGEAADLLQGHAKPQVYVFPGMSVVTAADFLAVSTLDPEVRTVFTAETVFGPPVLADARQAGFVTLAGPTSLHELIAMQTAVWQEQPDALFIIDGAFGRRMNAAEAYADTVIFAASAAGLSVSDFSRQVAHRQRLLTLPLVPDRLKEVASQPYETRDGMVYAKEITTEGTFVYLRGALTDRVLLHWLADGLTAGDAVIIEDRANAFVTEPVFRQMEQSGVNLYALKGADLKLIAFNPARTSQPEPYRAALTALAAVPVIELTPTPAIGKAI